MRASSSGAITPARSVTNPCGEGMAGSAARATGLAARNSARASRSRRTRPGLARVSCIEGVERVDDPLDLCQVLAELDTQRMRHQTRHAFTVIEEARDHREWPQRLLAGGEHLAIAH